MPTTITHSIFSYTADDYLDEISADFNVELAERRGTNGAIKKVKDYNPTNDFSMKGGGNPTIPVGVFSGSYTGLTGGVKYIQKFGHTEKNTDFDEFAASGKHYPNGTAG